MSFNELNQARVWTREVLPTTRPTNFLIKRDILILEDGTSYIWINGWTPQTLPIGSGTTPPVNGKDATVTIGTVTTNTLPAGSPALVSVTDSNSDPNIANLNFTFAIPQGDKGEPGTNTGGGTTVVSSLSGLVTPDEFADGKVIGDNTTRTLAALGYTNATAATKWPRVAANASHVGTIDVTTMSIDWITIQEAFLTMESTAKTSFWGGGARKYRLTHTLKLPREAFTGAHTRLTVDLGGAQYINASGKNQIVMDRFPPDMAKAHQYALYPLDICNGIIKGNGANTDVNNVALRCGANIKGSYKRLYCESAAVNIALYFNLMVSMEDCQHTSTGLYTIFTSDAYQNALGHTWLNATNSNSQCNMVDYKRVRCQPGGAATIVSAWYMKGGYDHNIERCNAENLGGTAQHLIFYEGSGDQVDHTLTINGFYYEVTGNVPRAIIRIRNEKGIATVNNVTGYVTGSMGAFIEGDNRAGTGTPTIVVTNCENTHTSHKFRSVVAASSPGYGIQAQVSWVIENVGMPDWKNVFGASNWITSGTPVWDGATQNSVIPDQSKMRYKAMFYDINQQLEPGTYDHPNYSVFKPLFGASSPVNTITPKIVGQTYVRTSTTPKEVYVSTGFGVADWIKVS